ncbi:uncharacterized protein [Epargyreus clarus]|uniref:uncharacterized protein n=1 Tax=Epargyreus clarus TaxID=520877 RepID=UPI003C2CBD02
MSGSSNRRVSDLDGDDAAKASGMEKPTENVAGDPGAAALEPATNAGLLEHFGAASGVNHNQQKFDNSAEDNAARALEMETPVVYSNYYITTEPIYYLQNPKPEYSFGNSAGQNTFDEGYYGGHSGMHGASFGFSYKHQKYVYSVAGRGAIRKQPRAQEQDGFLDGAEGANRNRNRRRERRSYGDTEEGVDQPRHRRRGKRGNRGATANAFDDTFGIGMLHISDGASGAYPIQGSQQPQNNNADVEMSVAIGGARRKTYPQGKRGRGGNSGRGRGNNRNNNFGNNAQGNYNDYSGYGFNSGTLNNSSSGNRARGPMMPRSQTYQQPQNNTVSTGRDFYPHIPPPPGMNYPRPDNRQPSQQVQRYTGRGRAASQNMHSRMNEDMEPLSFESLMRLPIPARYRNWPPPPPPEYFLNLPNVMPAVPGPNWYPKLTADELIQPGDKFNEFDILDLEVMFFSRRQVISALRKFNGKKLDALNYLNDERAARENPSVSWSVEILEITRTGICWDSLYPDI